MASNRGSVFNVLARLYVGGITQSCPKTDSASKHSESGLLKLMIQ